MPENDNIIPDRITKTKKDVNEKVKKKNFTFKTRGKITPEESKELKRTHGNVFDWVKKSRESLKEKGMFEKKIEDEIECEDMDVETMEKDKRLERVEKRKVFFDPKTCKWRIAYLTYYDNPA